MADAEEAGQDGVGLEDGIGALEAAAEDGVDAENGGATGMRPLEQELLEVLDVDAPELARVDAGHGGGSDTGLEDGHLAEAIAGADALVLVTEWREYQNPDFDRIKAEMRHPFLLDGRNIWSTYGLRKQGFIYAGIGVQGS